MLIGEVLVVVVELLTRVRVMVAEAVAEEVWLAGVGIPTKD